MYLRETKRRNRDGSVVSYLALAHNERDPDTGVSKARIIHNFGRTDRIDREALARLVRSVSRVLDPVQATVATADPDADGELPAVLDARPLGVAWVADRLWERLGIAAAVRRAAEGRRVDAEVVERVLFALVANRAIDPCSKLAAAEWVGADVAIPGLAEMDEDQAYRAMDLLVEADVEGQVQRSVFFAAADLLNLEVDILLFDTTSTYFERDDEEADGGLRRFGHSKDSRPDLPQIVIGLAVTREGIPVRVWTWPGNTNDHQVLPQVKDDLRGWRLGRVITVVDRGFSSKDNLDYLRRAGGHWIAGERMRDGAPDHDAALSRQGRYQQVRDNLRVKEVRLHGDDERRFVVCHNPIEADRDRARRDDTITRLEAELARITRRPGADGEEAGRHASGCGARRAHQGRVRAA